MTEIAKSGLPPLEQIREESTMRIITVNTSPFKRKQVETFMMVSNDGKYCSPHASYAVAVGSGLQPGPLVATLLHLDDERIKGFMPSKVWTFSSLFSMIEFNILYYINTTLPKAVKPFKDNTYLMYFTPRPGDVIEYDVNVRFFMDQIMVPGVGMTYVVMFGDESYEDIVLKEIAPPESILEPTLPENMSFPEKTSLNSKLEGWVKQALEWRLGDQK